MCTLLLDLRRLSLYLCFYIFSAQYFALNMILRHSPLTVVSATFPHLQLKPKIAKVVYGKSDLLKLVDIT